MRRFLLLPALFAVCAAPAAAEPAWGPGRSLHGGTNWGIHGMPGWQHGRPPLGLSQSVEGRFGVVSWRDRETGERRTEPVAALRYRINWGHETDAGWRVDFAIELEGATHGARHRDGWPFRP